MFLIHSSYEIKTIINRKEILRTIEEAGRISYKTEDKITEDSFSKFVTNLIKNNHLTPLEQIDLTIKFISCRSTSHQMVRHRLISILQESQRYVDYKKKGLIFIIPPFITDIKEGEYKEDSNYGYTEDNSFVWLETLIETERHYNFLIERGWIPEKARDILPNCTKTEYVIKTNLREWRHILSLRTDIHADIRIRTLLFPLLEELYTKLPEIFSDIYFKNISQYEIEE